MSNARPVTLLLAALMLAGTIAIVPQAAAGEDEEILAVSPDELPKIWRRVRGYDITDTTIASNWRAGCVAVSFIVERNGEPGDVRVLRAWPDTGFGDAVVRMLRTWRFEPTDLNADRLAAYTVMNIVLIRPDAQRRLGSKVPVAIDESSVAAQCAVDGIVVGGE
jgi:TonB family protein